MPDDAGGTPGAERVSRHATTPWYEPNPGARFQDYFNRDLGSVGMSGGAWEAITRARNLAAYVPGDLPNPNLELIILLPEAG